jgi:hypothetical protein
MRKKTKLQLNYFIRDGVKTSGEITKIFRQYLFHRILLSSLLLILAELTGLQAQTLYVRENNGTQISFAINDLQSITFPQSNVAVTKTDGSTSTYSFADIQYLSFSDFITGTDLVTDMKQAGLQIYPNPVSNRLYITFSSEKNEKVQLSVINLQGKVLQQQNMNCYKGANIAEMPVSDLKQGIYLFRFQNQKKTETIKFLKN